MEPDPDAELPWVSNRFYAYDEQGAGLRATWRPAHGFINLSLWRGNHCVETFHLTPVQASNLVGFVAGVLAEAVSSPTPSHLCLLGNDDEGEDSTG